MKIAFEIKWICLYLIQHEIMTIGFKYTFKKGTTEPWLNTNNVANPLLQELMKPVTAVYHVLVINISNTGMSLELSQRHLPIGYWGSKLHCGITEGWPPLQSNCRHLPERPAATNWEVACAITYLPIKMFFIQTEERKKAGCHRNHVFGCCWHQPIVSLL